MDIENARREFISRFAKHLWDCLSQKQRDQALTIAWEECAWARPLTNYRGERAMANAMQRVWDNRKTQ